MFELSSEISISTRPKRNNYPITNAVPVNFIEIRPMFVCVFKCLTKERNCINSIAKTDRVNKSDLNVVATRICSQLIVCPGSVCLKRFCCVKIALETRPDAIKRSHLLNIHSIQCAPFSVRAQRMRTIFGRDYISMLDFEIAQSRPDRLTMLHFIPNICNTSVYGMNDNELVFK